MGGVVYGKYKKLSLYNNFYTSANHIKETAEQNQEKENGLWQTKIDGKRKGYQINNRTSMTYLMKGNDFICLSYYASTNHLKPKSYSKSNGTSAMFSNIEERQSFFEQEATVKVSSTIGHSKVHLDLSGDYFNHQSNNKFHYYNDGDQLKQYGDKYVLDMYKYQADFTQQVSSSAVLKYGVSIQHLQSHESIKEQNYGNSSGLFTSQSSTKVKGLTPLAYLEATGLVKRIRYSLGANWKMNHIVLDHTNNQPKPKSTLWGINPTMLIMVPLDKKGSQLLNLSYQRTLKNIPYAAISNSVQWTDPYNYSTGNTKLKSPSMNVFMAVASLLHNKLNLTALYTKANNNIYWETHQNENEDNTFVTKPVNLPAVHMYGWGIEGHLSPVKSWQMKLSGRMEMHQENATLSGTSYSRTRLRQYYSCLNTVQFGRNWGGMLNLTLEPTFKTYDRTYHAVYNISGQVYKTACKNRLQLACSFQAFGNRRKLDRNINGYKLTYKQTMPVQQISLSATWMFSKGKRSQNPMVENGMQTFEEVKDSK